MSHDRFSAYRVMWLFVMFDLPTETKKDRKNATQFRKNLVENGFTMGLRVGSAGTKGKN